MAHVVLSCLQRDMANGAAGFVAAQAQAASMLARLDARQPVNPAGYWPQTKALIANPARAQAWLLLLPDHALMDHDVVDTLAYAMQGVPGTRRDGLPVVALRPGSSSLALPPVLSHVASVSLAETAWPETIRAAIERRPPRHTGAPPGAPGAAAYAICLHMPPCRQGGDLAAGPGSHPLALEFRPAPGNTWPSFYVAIPVDESGLIGGRLVHGTRGNLSLDGLNHPYGWHQDGSWLIATAHERADRRSSYYLVCGNLPTAVRFGVPGGHLQFSARLRPVKV